MLNGLRLFAKSVRVSHALRPSLSRYFSLAAFGHSILQAGYGFFYGGFQISVLNGSALLKDVGEFLN